MRKRVVRDCITGIALLSSFGIGDAQQATPSAGAPIDGRTPGRAPMAASAATSVPALVPFSSAAFDGKGKPLAGETSATFLIYKDQQGGEPLFTESQIVSFDELGRYKVQLGAANPNGLPSDLFATGEARWLEVQIAGQAAEARVLLASVPYALKAADAATLGGLPASAFALAGSNAVVASVAPAGITPDGATTVTTTGGTTNKVAKFSGTNTIVNSILYDNGTEVGIGTTAPSATLTVDGTMTVDGTSTLNGQVVLPATGTATASTGYDSQFLKFDTSAYDSSSKSAVPPRFQLEAEVTGNDTASPNATLNLLASATSSAPAETGLYFHTNGTIHFAPGQTFGATSSGGIAFNGTSTSNTGVEGTSSSGSGVVGTNANTTLGTAGVLGVAGKRNTSGFTGIAAVWGDSSASVGVFGSSDKSSGVFGQSASGVGVDGTSTSANGVYGFSSKTSGIHGETQSTSTGDAAVYGGSDSAAAGVIGASNAGIGGIFTGGVNDDGLAGLQATGGAGDTSQDAAYAGGPGGSFYGGAGVPSADVESFFGGNGGNGVSAYGGDGGGNGGSGVAGTGGVGDNIGGDGGSFMGGGSNAQGGGGDGIYAQYGSASGGGGYAGYFDGDVEVIGSIGSDENGFKIDHPSDSANKYLAHASVESSELMNIYTGNVTTDELGLATVTLPSWFQTLNTDFRYQLTVIGGRFAQAIVSKEIAGNKFTIMTNASAVKVSWQVTAVRQDAYALAHPLVVEQVKDKRERGFYKHPELYRQPAEKQIEWARHPEMMRRLQAIRNAQASGVKPGGKATLAEAAKTASSLR